MGDPWRLLATISEPQLCFGREISLKGPLDTVEIVIEYMDMVDNVNMDMIDTVPKRVPVGTFLAFWVPIGSLFIIEGPFFQCFGFIHFYFILYHKLHN